MDESYYYVATPFARYPAGHRAAYAMACRVTADLARAGIPVLSPIAHGQGLAEHGGIGPTDHDVWMTINAPLMRMARGMIVVMADGWKESRGVTEEIAVFQAASKPGDVPASLVPAQ